MTIHQQCGASAPQGIIEHDAIHEHEDEHINDENEDANEFGHWKKFERTTL